MLDDIRPPREPQDKNSLPNPAEPPQPGQLPPDEPAFAPPEVVAEREEPQPVSNSDDIEIDNTFAPPPQKKPNKFKEFMQRIWPDSKKGRIFASLLIALIVIGSGGGVFALLNKDGTAPVVKKPVAKKVVPKPTTEPSRLTGVTVPIEVNKRPVTAIQIENSPDARPQSGMLDAGVVFEAIAEGGITRFNVVYLEGQPGYIGPVRSIRPYYIDLFLPFDASIVHAGGSAEGLAKIRDLGVKDIDHGANGGAFQRVSDRFAPHNLYTSMAALDTVSQQRGYKTSTFTSYPRKKESPLQAVKPAAKPPSQKTTDKKPVTAPPPAPTAKTIDLAISSVLFNVHYDYEAATNSYLRSMGGVPHTDQRSGAQLKPKVVIALVMGRSQSGIYSVYQTSGTGEMFVFQDGQLQKGTWTKGGPKDQFVFTDAASKPLKLNPGQTWVTLVSAPNQVTSAP